MLQPTLITALLTSALLARATSVAGLIFVAAVFQASSVLNVVTPKAAITGTVAYGVTPSMVMALVAGMLLLLEIWRQRGMHIPRHLRLPLGLLVAYVLVACLGAWFLPRWFAGTPVHLLVKIYGAEEAPVPLVATLSNAVQAINIVALLVVLLYLLAAVRTPEARQRLVAGVALACTLVVGIGLYEQAAPSLASPSLVPLLANNPGYSQVPLAPMGYVLTRIGLPFTEPSYASAYMAAMTLGVLAVALLGRGWWWALLAALLCAVGLVNTLGSTGLAAAGVAVCVLVPWVVLRALRPTTGLSLRLRAALLCTLLLLASVWGWRSYEAASWRPKVDAMFQGLIVDKAKQTDGVREKTNQRALQIAQETRGLGVGLGSNRASSFFASLLSNTGVLGTALFTAMLGTLLWRYWCAPVLSDMQIFVATALPTATLAMGLGIPDLNMPMYWGFVFLGFVFCPPRREG